MKNYTLITDSGCDITVEDEKRYGIDIMPFDIMIGDECLKERIDITSDEFMHKIDLIEEIPKTSQITQFRFEQKLEECVAAGMRDVILVTINSAGSQTYQNAVQAAEALKADGRAKNTNFYVLDSHTYSIGYGYPLVEAAKKLEAGQSIERVVAYMRDWFDCLEVYLIAFNLRHMKKSGRIKAAAAFMGELMNLKPIIEMIDDNTQVVMKCRGEKKAIADAVDYIKARAIPKTPFLVARSLARELEDEFIEAFSEKMGDKPAMVNQVGCAVSSNAGTKFVGVFIKGQKRR